MEPKLHLGSGCVISIRIPGLGCVCETEAPRNGGKEKLAYKQAALLWDDVMVLQKENTWVYKSNVKSQSPWFFVVNVNNP